MRKPAKLEWFGRAAHFICGNLCRFHLATLINNKWMVSTVGELWLERPSREIHAKSADPEWLKANAHRKGDDFDFAYMQRFGFETIGCDRKYETMVFKVSGKRCTRKDCGCGLPEIIPSELDFNGYNTAGDAHTGHHAMVKKWSAPRSSPKDAAASREG